MIGVLVNTITVILGAFIGLVFRSKIPQKVINAVMTAVGKPLEIREVELAEPKSDEVLVKILATAVWKICLHYFCRGQR